ncbi:MAG: hypothetical protein RIB84_10185 [Sneathiellaceae bacterium]
MRNLLNRLRRQPIGEVIRDARIEMYRDRERELVRRALNGQRVYDELERVARRLSKATGSSTAQKA